MKIVNSGLKGLTDQITFILNEMTVNITICKYLGLKLKKYEYFHPFEVVGRGSETQLQVGEKLN